MAKHTGTGREDFSGTAAGGGDPVVVRAATLGDADGIDDLRLDCFPRMFDAAMGRGGRDRKHAALRALRRCATGAADDERAGPTDHVSRVVVAVDAEGVVVGHAAYSTAETDAGSVWCRTRALVRALGPVRTARFLVARTVWFLRHDVGPDEAYIFDIAVAPSWRGQRLGERVVRLAEERSAAEGARMWVALVGVDNIASRALMESLGYSAAGLVTNRWRGRVVGEGELVRYEKHA